MFTVFCPRHRSRVLLGARAIDAVENTADGIVVHWHCHCGAHGTVATGRPTQTAAAPAHATATAA